MSAVLELTNVKRIDLLGNDRITGLEGISFLAQPSDATAPAIPAAPALDFANMIGLVRTEPSANYVVDDLALGQMSGAERTVVCALLQQLRQTLNASSALARNTYTAVVHDPVEGARLRSN